MNKLGKYEIVEEIGRGGFGTVYKARDVLDRVIALKVLLPALVYDRTAMQRFQREALVTAQLRHPNIVFIYDFGDVDGAFYIAMEYLAGRPLSQLLHPGTPLELATVAPIVMQIAAALDFAHAHGVIHRDVKPSNIILSDDGHATLTDFGLLHLEDGSSLSISGIVGTPEYMAPEQAEPHAEWPQDGRMDVYSLGVVVYQMLTGELPYQADTPVALLRAHIDHPISLAGEHNPGLPLAIQDMLTKALAINPADRFQTAGEFAQALSEIAALEQEKSDQEKQLSAWYVELTDSIAAGKWVDALSCCAQIVKVNPAYRDVSNLMVHVADESAKDRARLQLWRDLQPDYEQALVLFKQNKYDEAIVRLQGLRVKEPNFPQAKEKLDEVVSARERWQAELKSKLVRLYDEGFRELEVLRDKARQIIAEDANYPDPTGWLAIVKAMGVILAQENAQVGGCLDQQQINKLPGQNEMPVLHLGENVVLELVHIPAGEFLMGSVDNDENAQPNEMPQHGVFLDDYFIGRYPVTVKQFGAFVEATNYVTTAEREGSGRACNHNSWHDVVGADWEHPSGPNSDVSMKGNHPVTQVSWNDAVAFCRWATEVAGCRVQLPTEAQWEKAARGEDGREWPWGNRAPNQKRCNFNTATKGTTPVGRYSAHLHPDLATQDGDSPYGCSDMAGNVWEWCADWFDEETYQRQEDQENRDPLGPRKGKWRVIRGGAFDEDSDSLRCASRDGDDPSSRNDNSGFRVCVDLSEVVG